MPDEQRLVARLLAGVPGAEGEVNAMPEVNRIIPDQLARLAPIERSKALAGILIAAIPDPAEQAAYRRAVFAIDPRGESQEADKLALALLSADTILTAVWPEPVWAVPNLLPAGLTILAGPPKVGKSWLALQIAQAVAAGGRVFGEVVERGPILYLALEDPPRRLQDRMTRQGWPRGLSADFMPVGEFGRQIGPLLNGGAEKLSAQIEVGGYRLVVIDTLSRAITGDQNDAEQMTRGLTPLQEAAHRLNTAVILNDHHRKGSALGSDPDAIADILGSTAKGAMADSVLGLYRERGKPGAKLAVTGRDFAERTLALEMDWATGVWQFVADADELALTERRQEIIDALRDLGKASLKQIAEAIGQDRSNTRKRLQDLVNAGLVRREGESYGLP